MHYLMIRNIKLAKDKNGNDYLSCSLSHKGGVEIDAKKWQLNDREYEAFRTMEDGEIVKVDGRKTEWAGKDQFEISAIERLSEEEAKSIDVSEYILTAPEPSEEMFAFLLARAEALGDEKLRTFAVEILKENKESLLYYPAAMSNHHAYYGGLLYHVKRMLMLAESVAEVYDEIDADLLAVGVLMHDIGKLRELKANRYGVVGSYTPEGNMLTHIILGILYVSEKAKAIGLPEETRLMIEHMILSHHYLPEFGSPVMPAFPEAEALHHIDNLDASVTFMTKELGSVHGGSMSEWVRGLEGRKLYKKK